MRKIVNLLLLVCQSYLGPTLGFIVVTVGSKAFKYDAILLNGLVVRYITVNLVGVTV